MRREYRIEIEAFRGWNVIVGQYEQVDDRWVFLASAGYRPYESLNSRVPAKNAEWREHYKRAEQGLLLRVATVFQL